LLCRTNENTRQFADFQKLETFLREHLKCNPYYQGENLLGIAGFDIFAWSEYVYNQIPRIPEIQLSDEAKEMLRRLSGDTDDDW